MEYIFDKIRDQIKGLRANVSQYVTNDQQMKSFQPRFGKTE